MFSYILTICMQVPGSHATALLPVNNMWLQMTLHGDTENDKISINLNGVC